MLESGDCNIVPVQNTIVPMVVPILVRIAVINMGEKLRPVRDIERLN